MLNIKNTISFAAILCGLLIILSAPKQASAQFIPPGSYQKSCKQISIKSGSLSANCNPKGQSTLSKVLGAGEEFHSETEDLRDYFECDGDIWNDDGQLKCKRNTNSALMQKAKAAITITYPRVTGLEFSKEYSTMQNYLRSMLDDGLTQKFYEGNMGGIFGGASYDWFVKYFNKSNMASIKSQIITRAFYDVYGSGQVQPADFAKYNSAQVGYNDIVFAEKTRMNAPLGIALRTIMIVAAYKTTMGRAPVKNEYDYWTPKKEGFKELVAASRAFLYAPNGANDLAETVKRRLAAKGNKNPSLNQINEAISNYSQTKAIYDEMN